MKSYLELRQCKCIIMLMAQFGCKIWWQALFLGDGSSHGFAAVVTVHNIYGNIRYLRPPNNVDNCTLFGGSDIVGKEKNEFEVLF